MTRSHNKLISNVGAILMGLFIFIVMIDPTNTVLHKKDIVFILVVAFNLIAYKPDMGKIPYIMILFCGVAIPWIISQMRMAPYDENEVLGAFKSISPIILLLWINRYDMVKIARLPVILCCVLSLVIYIIIDSDTTYEGAFWLFMQQYDYPVNVSRRYILGIEILGFYLKSCVSFLMVLAYYILAVIGKTKFNLWTVLSLAVIVAYFLISGTRSTMLAPFFLFIMITAKVYKNTKYYKYITYPIIAILALLFSATLITMATETEEYSNAIKYAHIGSYLELFEENPIYLLLGQGPGTGFYSEGFGEFVYKTEWSYLELLRCYGVFSLLITFVFARPLYAFWKARNQNHLTYCIFWSYLTYLIIAGTNPLLLSSTGMITLLMAYSYWDKIAADSQNIVISGRLPLESSHSNDKGK